MYSHQVLYLAPFPKATSLGVCGWPTHTVEAISARVDLLGSKPVTFRLMVGTGPR